MTFDTLIQEISAGYHFGPKGRALVEEAVDLIARQPGGISGFLERFRVAGFGDEVTSWLEGATPVPLSGQEVEQALGSDTLREIAHKVGASQSFVRTVLGYAIPKIIHHFTQAGLPVLALPLGFLPAAEEALRRGPEQKPAPGLEGGMERAGAAPRRRERLIPVAALLALLGVAGYLIHLSAGHRAAPPSSPFMAQTTPLEIPPAPSKSGTSIAQYGPVAHSQMPAASDKTPVSSPSQTSLHLPAIYFAKNGAKVAPASKAILERAAVLMKQLPVGTVVQISGFADRIGTPAANLKISRQRADAVRQALVDAGLDPAMLSTAGYGFLPSTQSEKGTREGRSAVQTRRREDRRVELHLAP